MQPKAIAYTPNKSLTHQASLFGLSFVGPLLGPLASAAVNGFLGSKRVWIIDRILFEQVSNSWALFNGTLPILSIIILYRNRRFFN